MDDVQQDAADASEALTRQVPILVAALHKHQNKSVSVVAEPAANLEYHLFADAMYWTDELKGLPGELDDAFRMVLNHRTSLVLGEVGRFPLVWQAAKECFPHWVGFHSERCAANAEIADRIRRIRRVSVRQLERWAADPNKSVFKAD
jgi:hypothetical protein